MWLVKIINAIFALNLFLFYSLNTLAAVPTQIIAGGYVTNDNYAHPLLALSYDYGRSFLLQKEIAGFPSIGIPVGDPRKSINVKIESLSCLFGYCAAVGRYGTNIPFLISSHNRGANWSNELTIPNFPKRFSIFENMNCKNLHCIAVGGTDNHLTVLYSGRDGQNWSVSSITGLPKTTSDAALLKSACLNENCVAVGTRFENNFSKKFPLIMVSNDAGKSWKYLDVPTVTKEGGELFDATCNPGNQCVAVGELEGKSLVIRSKDVGLSWESVKPISGLPTFKTHKLKKVSCSGSTCVAFGYYLDGKTWQEERTYPLILTSHDFGTSWEYQNVPKIASSPTIYFAAQQVMCSGVTCIAIGTTEDAKTYITKSVILVSNHRGKYWKQADKFLHMPSNVGEMIFRSVNQIGNMATIVGRYNRWMPLILTSHDRGNSWEFVSITGLPSDIKGGELYTNSM